MLIKIQISKVTNNIPQCVINSKNYQLKYNNTTTSIKAEAKLVWLEWFTLARNLKYPVEIRWSVAAKEQENQGGNYFNFYRAMSR